MSHKRDFKGIWIPKEVWLEDNLTIQEKVFLVEINSLDNEVGCWASNNYFAKFFKLSKARCSQIITGLEKKNTIAIEYIKDDKGSARRYIKLVNSPIKNIKRPPIKKAKANNINNINNTLYFNNKDLNNAFIKYIEYRIEIKKPLTKYALELHKEGLKSIENKVAILMINQSIKNGWLGLFEIKENNTNGQTIPDYYNSKFERTLEGNELINYHKHLRKLGWSCTHSPTAGSVWRKR